MIAMALNLHDRAGGPAEPEAPAARRRRVQCSAKGFWSERLVGAEPRAARIMSMRARNVAGTCRCPG
jgi:hypothetical protein